MSLDERFRDAVRDLDASLSERPLPSTPELAGVGIAPGMGMAVAIALVMVVGTLGLLLLPGTQQPEFTTTPIEPVPETAPVVDDTLPMGPPEPAPPTAPPITWKRVVLPGLVEGYTLAEKAIALVDCGEDGVCGPPRGFVAVGSGPNGQARSGLVWTSLDGDEWHLATVFTEEGQRVHLHDVAYRDGVVVAVGGVDPRSAVFGQGDEPFDPMIWRSEDLGASWDLVARADSLAPEEAFGVIRSVIAVDDGFLAGGPGGTWTSSDGLSWVRHPLNADIREELVFSWIVEVDSGFLAWALGTDEWELHSRFLASEDGRSWETLLFGADLSTEMLTWGLGEVVQAPGGGLVGGVTYGRPPIMVSDDGTEWAPVASDLPTDAYSGMQAGVSADRVGDAVVVFGHHGPRGVPRRIIGWWTEDSGRTWVNVPTPSEAFGQLAGPHSEVWGASTYWDSESQLWGMIVAGRFGEEFPTGYSGFSDAAVWIGTVQGP